MATFATVAVLMLPTSTCGAVPPRDKKNDDEKGDDLIKKLTENLPENVRDNAALFLASSGSSLKSAFESGVPAQFGYGFTMGFASGFCIKKVSKLIAFGVGGIFILVQTLQYNGYIKVDYQGIQKDVESYMDLNGDGKVDAKDAELGFEKMKSVLSYNMPSGGGFGTGLLMGLRG
eukprot:CAMPEP_0174953730 /NCGR_PEP_ID=MMETSP0004_2-20121128/19_1 /TAXON_ID=420556 /ORGANISM="Ochromonas sp., Strain CCMP1393" /LENGTH=174 /DNA_ID=CAMNT_0016201441 /DNA_START=96 /DNA_END=620 /DNA_ORIENTATION=+